MRRDGRFKEFGFIDFNLFHAKWQYHLLKMLRKNVKVHKTEEEIDRCWKEYPNVLAAYIEKGDVPKGFQRIRYYDLHATCRDSRTREELKGLL